MKRKIALIIALVCGALAALLTRFYLSAKDAEVRKIKGFYEEKYGTIEVLCFATDLPGGATLQKSDLG